MKLELGDYSKLYFWVIELETEIDYAPAIVNGVIVNEDKIIAIYFDRKSAESDFKGRTKNDFFSEWEEERITILNARLRLVECVVEGTAAAEDNRLIESRDLV